MRGHTGDGNYSVKIQTLVMGREGVLDTMETLEDFPGEDAHLAFRKETRMQVSFSSDTYFYVSRSGHDLDT